VSELKPQRTTGVLGLASTVHNQKRQLRLEGVAALSDQEASSMIAGVTDAYSSSTPSVHRRHREAPTDRLLQPQRLGLGRRGMVEHSSNRLPRASASSGGSSVVSVPLTISGMPPTLVASIGREAAAASSTM